MLRDSHRHRYFSDYCENLRRIGLIELIDEHRRRVEQRAWRASLIEDPVRICVAKRSATSIAG